MEVLGGERGTHPKHKGGLREGGGDAGEKEGAPHRVLQHADGARGGVNGVG